MSSRKLTNFLINNGILSSPNKPFLGPASILLDEPRQPSPFNFKNLLGKVFIFTSYLIIFSFMIYTATANHCYKFSPNRILDWLSIFVMEHFLWSGLVTLGLHLHLGTTAGLSFLHYFDSVFYQYFFDLWDYILPKKKKSS